MRETLAERFWPKVARGHEDACWLWTASLTTKGYGQIAIARGRPIPAHRAALLVAGIDLTDGQHVHHTCENKRCVNPAHLEVVDGQREHSSRHLAGCGRHGESDMRTIRSGRNVGVRYCSICNRERTRRRSHSSPHDGATAAGRPPASTKEP